MERLDRVELFLEVVRHRSFTAAARALGTSGSAISKQIQNLEAQLGVRLLTRTTRHVAVTEAGALYYERARKAFEDLAEAEQQIQDLGSSPQGSLKISAPMSFGTRYLTTALAEFAASHPGLHMQVDFDDRHVDVVGEGYDVVVRIASLTDSTLVARRLAPCPILLCASPSYLAQEGTPTAPEDLVRHRHIIYNRNGLQTEWRYRDKSGRDGSVDRKPHCVVDSAEMLAAALVAGVGIGLLPIFAAAPLLRQGELLQVLPALHTSPQRDIHAVYPQNRYLSTKVRLLIDTLVSCCKTLPWQEEYATANRTRA